jgi:ferritin-like metal-binding protein YciE
MKSINSETFEYDSQRAREIISEKANTNKIKGLYKLLVNELKEVYWAEDEVKKCFRQMIKHTSSLELSDELTRHFDIVEEQKTILGEVFLLIDEKVEDHTCKPIEVLLKEADIFLDETKKGITRDAAIISLVVKIELYQIASYSVLCFFAKMLSENNAGRLLRKNLDQKEEYFEKLSQLIDSMEPATVQAEEVPRSM